MSEPERPIDVKELIRRFSVEDLNRAAEDYWQRLLNNPRIMTKPFNLGEVEHLLPQIGFLIQGLRMYPGMTVLDFGAGSCYASRILNQLGLRVISVEVSPTALEIGKRISERWPPIGDVPEHTYSLFDGRRLPAADESVDRIFCLDAFHHVPDQRAVLGEMGRVLKRGGIAGFCEPGPRHSTSPEAQAEMRNCTVIENDVVLATIFADARAFGFTDLKVAVATIHPPLVGFDEVARYLSEPGPLVGALRERIENFPIYFLYKGEATITDSRDPAGLTAVITPEAERVSVRAGEAVRIRIDVRNTSTKVWLASGGGYGCVNVGAMLHRQGAGVEAGPAKEYRYGLSTSDVEPGGVVAGVAVQLEGLASGEYVLDVDLVSENVCWFGWHSDAKVSVRISVTP